MQHPRPDHREGRAFLPQVRRRPHRGIATAATREIEQLHAAPRQPFLARHDIRQQHLDARVRHVHHLLVVRAIDEDVVHARTQPAFAQLQDRRQRRIVGREHGPRREWESRPLHRQRVQHDRLGSDLHADHQVASRPPPRRAGPTASTPAQPPLVAKTHEDFPRHRAAVALRARRVVELRRQPVKERLRPFPTHVRARPAGKLQYRVAAKIIVRVDQHRDLVPCRQPQRRPVAQQPRPIGNLFRRHFRAKFEGLGPGIPRQLCPHPPAAPEVMPLLGQCGRLQGPARLDDARDIERDLAAHHGRRHPLHLPRIQPGQVHVTGAADDVIGTVQLLPPLQSLQPADAPRRDPGREPGRRPVEAGARKTSAPAHAPLGGLGRARPPDQRFQPVRSGAEFQFVGRIGPMGHIPRVRPARDHRPIQRQRVAQIRAHLQPDGLRPHRLHVQPEQHGARLAFREVGVPEPRRAIERVPRFHVRRAMRDGGMGDAAADGFTGEGGK